MKRLRAIFRKRQAREWTVLDTIQHCTRRPWTVLPTEHLDAWDHIGFIRTVHEIRRLPEREAVTS